jgi:hypothetical protein
MSTLYCPSCGAEYVAGTDECAECFVPLVDRAATEARRQHEPDDEEVVYELAEWDPDLRQQLSKALSHEGIHFEWEGDGDLIVWESDADRVDSILDELEDAEDVDEDRSDELPPVDSDDDDGAGEAAEVLGDLFVAADRLMHAPADARLAADAADVAGVVVGLGTPYGFAPREWERVVGLAGALREAIEDAPDDEEIAVAARDVRELLRRFV